MSEAPNHPNPLRLTRSCGTLRDNALISHVPSQYSLTQIQQYFARVGLPELAVTDFSPTLENLEQLIQFHMLAFPFENTDMHYTPEHKMDVTPSDAFKRMVLDGKGSYCFGHSTLLLEVLRALKYRTYAGCGRVNISYDFFGPLQLGRLAHVIHFVQPFPLNSDRNRETYIVDLWFGSQTYPRPFLLSDKEDNVIEGVSPYERFKLSRRLHPKSSLDKSSANAERVDVCWYLEYQRDSNKVPHEANTPTRPWRVLYTFTEDEFFSEDIQSGSFVICNSPGNMFMNNVIVVRHFAFDQLNANESAVAVDAEEEFADYSEDQRKSFFWKYIMYGNEVKRVVGRKSESVMIMNTEDQRIRALRHLFKIDIPADGHKFMSGRPPCLDTEGKEFSGETFPNFT